MTGFCTRLCVCLMFVALAGADPAVAQQLLAGAAKVDITPTKAQVKGTDSIRDALFARAIYVENGANCAVLVGVDQGGIATQIVKDVIARVSGRVKCPEENFVISATHTHSGGTAFGGLGGEPSSERVTDAIVSAISRAASKPRRVNIGYGVTHVDLNTNRDLFDAQGRWVQGPNPAGASDKALAVIDFIGTDGVPVAVYMNYAMHPINFFMTGVVSADFPGDASRFVESTFGEDTVAIFSQGASGDQNPRMLEVPYLIRIRAGQGEQRQVVGLPPFPSEQTANGRSFDFRNPGVSGVPARDLQAYTKLVARNGQWVTAQGTLIGEATVDLVRSHIKNRSSSDRIWTGRETFSCPGRDRLDAATPAREGVNPGFKDGADVNITVGVLSIGEVQMVWIDGEVYSEIAQRLKRESPFTKTLMVTLANGFANSGYIYSDSASEHLTFQVIGSRLKPRCAEDKVVATALKLIAKSQGS